MNHVFDLCKHCDHFIDQNYCDGEEVPEGVCEFIHCCDEEHHNPDDHHNAEPRGTPKTLEQWKLERPDLFVEHEDGLIGPNSEYHKSPETPEWFAVNS